MLTSLNRRKLNKRLLAAVTAASVIGTSAFAALGDELVEAIRAQQAAVISQQAQTMSDLEYLRSGISALEEQKQAVLAQIDAYDAGLVTTIATIETLEKSIEKQERELKKTAENLTKAKEDEATEYEAMKKRIQYMYEEGGNMGLVSTMMSAGKISDVLNQADNTQKMYNYDRDCLASYTATVEKVEKLQKKQQQQKAELFAMKKEQENVKAQLEELKEQAKAANEDYEAQITYCEGIAAEYQALIEEQNAQIWQLQAAEAEAVAAEQARIYAAQQAAAQAAAAEAAAQQQAQQQAAAQQQTVTQTDAGLSGDQMQTMDAYGNAVYDDTAMTMDAAAGDAYTDLDGDGIADTYAVTDGTMTDGTGMADAFTDLDGDGLDDLYGTTYDSMASGYTDAGIDYSGYTDPQEALDTAAASTGSSLGSEIANFATQFVGNPYVWGGTSLTDGADCSGFVQSVFSNYGINLSRTTYTQANEGTPVSYSDMQPGDVINYGFHTAIYLGDNKIVHAADESTGIIIGDNPAYQPIVTIRRFV